MGQQYLIDTNVVMDYIAEVIPVNGMTFLDGIVDAGPYLSLITRIELLSWNIDVTMENVIRQFIADSHVLGINEDVVQQCIAARRLYKLKTPDAVIAATSLVNGMCLVTRNTKDFNRVAGLQLINPWEL